MFFDNLSPQQLRNITKARIAIATAINVCKQVSQILPKKDDTLLTSAFKIASGFDIFFPLKQEVSIQSLGYEVVRNDQFHSMFRKLGVSRQFLKQREEWGDKLFVSHYTHPTLGDIYCVENDLEVDYYVSPGFNYQAVVDESWKQCNNIINMAPAERENYWSKAAIVLNPGTADSSNHYGKAATMLDEFIKTNSRYKDGKISRSYLFVGVPGTGKTTMAVKFASSMNLKTLNMSSRCLADCTESEIKSVMELLKPDCILVDEVDKISLGGWNGGGSTPYIILERIRTILPGVSIIFTANNLGRLDGAMLRPGRIDDVIEFEIPDLEDRKQIIVGYVNEYKVDDASEELINSVATKTEGLSGAWLKDLVLKMKHGEADKIPNTIDKMLSLIARKESAEKKFQEMLARFG